MNTAHLFGISTRTFQFYPALVKEFNISVNACVFICFISWKAYESDPSAWRSYSQEAIENETGLTKWEQMSARKLLVKAGLMEEDYDRIGHVVRFRPTPRELGASWESQLGQVGKTNLGKLVKPTSLKGNNSIKKQGGDINELPEGIRTPELKAAWANWITYRAAKHKPVSPFAAKLNFAEFQKMGPEKAVAAINFSIKMDYQGVYPPRELAAGARSQKPSYHEQPVGGRF